MNTFASQRRNACAGRLLAALVLGTSVNIAMAQMATPAAKAASSTGAVQQGGVIPGGKDASKAKPDAAKANAVTGAAAQGGVVTDRSPTKKAAP